MSDIDPPREAPAQLMPPFDQVELRHHLGRFTSGITVVAGLTAQGPVGMACQSFTAVSLEPPRVLICPMKASRSWAALARTGQFAINVLGEQQADLCSVFGRPGVDKFAAIEWSPAPVTGAPRIEGVIACFECRVAQTVDAGDHWIVLADLLSIEKAAGDPLLFDRGTYRRLAVPREQDRSAPVLFTDQHVDWWL